ncbi:MAG TPA: M13 family metallopeptidase [Longimicrobium sp.]|nr:M13 family metallopeptidase [Longimicrobium sp.]
MSHRIPAARAARIALAALAVVLAPRAAHAQAAPQPRSGVTRAYMDTTCAPCRNFFRYANGAWIDRAVIPPDRSAFGAGVELRDRNLDVIHRLLDQAAASAASPGTEAAARVGTFYRACTDSAAVEAAGLHPIDAELAAIDAIRAPAEVQAVLARLHALGVGAGFGLSIDSDLEESGRYLIYVSQGGLGLPDRDYYTRTDSASEALRREYRAHVARTLALAGMAPAQAEGAAGRVLAFETALARASLTSTEMRDPHAIYRKHTIARLAAVAPHLEWSRYFRDLGVPQLAAPGATVSAAPEAFLRTLDSTLVATPAADWRAYLRWRVVDQMAPALSSSFAAESFRFGQRLTGQQAMLPRWRRCAMAADQWMGEALGQAYVAQVFPPESKARVQALVENLRVVLRERIRQAAWMSDATRAEALRKIDGVTVKIGYPDRWRDYSGLQLPAGAPYAGVQLAARRFEVHRQLSRAANPVDRAEWWMTPPTVDAYSNPLNLEIVFPAGILQPPFFDPTADEAANYGAIGMVIGHELVHLFDDQGRQFDARGNLHDWWTPADAARFTERAGRVVRQFDELVAIDTLHVNGRHTLGENIADLGGISLALEAYHRSLGGREAPVLEGLTGDQRFFLGAAQAWRSVWRPDYLRNFVLTNEHSPPVFRVNAPLSNLPEFARAFGCKEGDPMVRPEAVRASIW